MKTKFPDAPAGRLPLGFVALDLAHALNLPLIDPDDNYRTIEPGQHTRLGNGLIGGDRKNPKVVVAANGGSDLIYVPDGDKAMAKRVVDVLLTQDYVSGIFVDSKLGKFPGTLTLDDIALEGTAVTPHPAIAINFRSFDTVCGEPVRCTVEVADTVLQQGQGMHGSFSRGDTWNFMAMQGPDFKSQFVDPAPASNADVGRTIAQLMQLHPTDKGKLVGRVISEALPNGALPDVTSRVVTSDPAPNGIVTVINMQMVGTTRYFDAAGFPRSHRRLVEHRSAQRDAVTTPRTDAAGAWPRYIRTKLRPTRRPSSAIQSRMAMSTSSNSAGSRRGIPPGCTTICECATTAASVSRSGWFLPTAPTATVIASAPLGEQRPSRDRVLDPLSHDSAIAFEGPTSGWPRKGVTAANSRHGAKFRSAFSDQPNSLRKIFPDAPGV